MQIQNLKKEFDNLQQIYGDKNLDAIYGAGEISNPKLCLVFMNPTGRNLSSSKKWKGLKAPWISTKNVWRMFYQIGLINNNIYEKIKNKKASDWDYNFAKSVYKEIKNNRIYITNLSKATQVDARPLKDEIFEKYLDLFKKEVNILNPEIIITFGNQVSSVLLSKNIKVSEYRKKYELIDIKGKKIKVFPVYYPVGQGMRNIEKAKEDVSWIINNS